MLKFAAESDKRDQKVIHGIRSENWRKYLLICYEIFDIKGGLYLAQNVPTHHQVSYQGGGEHGVENLRTYQLLLGLQLLRGFLQIADEERDF